MRLYHKLTILFLALSIIPMLFIGYISLHNAEKSIEKEILSNLQNVTAEGANEIETFIAERKADLTVLRHHDIFKTTIPILDQFSNDRTNPAYITARKEIDARLAIFQTAYGYIDVMLANKQGKIIYVLNPKHEYELNQSIFDKDAVLTKIKNDIYVGEIHKAGDKQNPHTLYLAGSAVDETDTILGVIHFELDMEEVFDRLYSDTNLGDSGEIIWVRKTPDSKVLFLSPLKHDSDASLKKDVVIGSNMAIPAQKAALGESGLGRSIDYRGKKVLSAWRPIKSLGWGFTAKIDEKEAFLPIEKFRKLLIVTVLVIIFSVTVTVLATVKSISGPIGRLCKGTEIIGGGNFDYKIGTDAKDEVGQLSRAFDKMTENLKNTTTSIECLNKEITERKQAEEAIKEKTRLNKILLDAMPCAALLLRPSTREIVASNAAAVKAGAVPGCQCFATWGQRETPCPWCMAPNLWETGIAQHLEVNGLGIIWDAHWIPVSDDLYMHYAFDITEQRQAEKTVQQINKSLEIANLRLREHDKLKNEFVATVTHELRTPLCIFRNIVSNALSGVMGDISEKLRDNLVMADDAIGRLGRIISDFLDVSKIDAGRMELNIKRFSLQSAIAKTVKPLMLLAKEKGITITIDAPSDGIFVDADHDRIVQILTNLIGNALKFTPNSGCITVKATDLNEEVILNVQDNGIGISADEISKIFNRFVQIEKFTGPGQHGTGLGLSITKDLVEMHGGRIWVESTPGNGSIFCFALPKKSLQNSVADNHVMCRQA